MVATTQLAANRSLHLLRVGDELILVGAAEHGVTPLRVYNAGEAAALGLLEAGAVDASAIVIPEQRSIAPPRARASAGRIAARPGRCAREQPRAAGHARPARPSRLGHARALSTPVQLLLLLTLLSVLPGALLMVTGFTRILIVLGFVRNALGTPTMPPNQVLVGHRRCSSRCS